VVEPSASIDVAAEPAPTRGLVVLLHGGRSRGDGRVHRGRLAYRRLLPFARALRRAGRDRGLAVWLLRYRVRGWNAPDLDPVRDARWALDRAHERHAGVPIVLVGHSMGGRAALRVADDRAVVAVCALAPWIEDGEPVRQLAGRSLLIAHGDRERMTDPRQSYRYAVAARGVASRVARFDVIGDGHAMLRRAGDWTDLVCRYVLGELDMRPVDAEIAAAMAAPSPTGLRTPLGSVGR